MTIPMDVVKPVLDILPSTINDLRDLPHIGNLNEVITSLQNLLLEQRGRSWKEPEDSALQKLQEALQNTSRLAVKWKKSRLRLLLEPSTFADELIETFRNIWVSFNKLQVRPKDTIEEQLKRIMLELSDGGDRSELNKAEGEFKKKFLDFLRHNYPKSGTSEDSVATALAQILVTGVDVIKQELQEMKENAGTVSALKVDTQLIEQLVLNLSELEKNKCKSDECFDLTAFMAEYLKCGLCKELMVNPVVIDSGQSFCKACIEEEFHCGGTVCPVTKDTVSKRLVVNVVLRKMLPCSDDAECPGEGAESSDANFGSHFFDEPLDIIAKDRVQNYLDSESMPTVLEGLADLTKCTTMPGGKHEVFKAGAIPFAITLAKNPSYTRKAVKLMKALTSSNGIGGGDGPDKERTKIILKVAEALDVLIMLLKRPSRVRLLAAETIANILANRRVRDSVLTKDGIVSAFVQFSKVDAADQKRADLVCLKGLTRLAKCSSKGDKTQIIVAVLLKLLRKGLKNPEFANLTEDSLIALDTQVLVMGRGTPANEVWSLVWQHMTELMVNEEFVSHSSIPGRRAIVSILTKLCGLYKEDITENLFLYLLKMMKSTRLEVMSILDSEEDVKKQVEDLRKLLSLSVTLLCFCVTHAKNMAQAVLTTEERNTLQEMVMNEPNSGVLDRIDLELMSIFDQLNIQSSQAAGVGEVAILVKMMKSPAQACQVEGVRRLRKIAEGHQDLTEMQVTGGVDAVMELMKESSNGNCQQDALIVLQALPPSIVIQTNQLPPQLIFKYLNKKWPIDVRKAAVGLLDLMVKENAVDANMFTATTGALEATLNWLKDNPECPGSKKCASALLKIAAKDGNSVCLEIANAGLDILVSYVRESEEQEFKNLLTNVLALICKSGNDSKEAVIKAGGHVFLLTSLRTNILKETAAQGLMHLISNETTRVDVLNSGFVKIAVESIDSNFAGADIALGLESICSTQEGLNQIYATPKCASALLILLEECPKVQGKGSAAVVISKLYPRLNHIDRQKEMTYACGPLIKLFERDDYKDGHKLFLGALAAFTTDTIGRKAVYQERVLIILIKYLRENKTDSQDLVLKILADMSSVIADGPAVQNYHSVLDHFIKYKIAEVLCPLARSEASKENTESMKYLLILIRNLSIAGQTYEHLSELGAVSVLLEVLKQHKSSLSIVTGLAVKALEKFMDTASGKKEFLRGGGIKYLVSVLKLSVTRNTSDAMSLSTLILIAVAKDPHTRRDACKVIFGDSDILYTLNAVMYHGETIKTKWQAAVLMKLLAMYGPTSKVCNAFPKPGCLIALRDLRLQPNCKEMADNVLLFARDHSKECKSIIDSEKMLQDDM